jgi:hypothetical protein
MTRKIFFLLFFIAGMSAAIAKSPDTPGNAEGKKEYTRILLIPYNPMMHLSDADQDIGEFSELNGKQVRAAFRAGIMSHVSERLSKIYPTTSLASTTTSDYDLDMVYSWINYRMDTIFSITHPVVDDSLQKKKSFFSKILPAKTKEVHDVKFMNVTLHQNSLLTRLGQKYDADLFVFLNQFEIVTNYSDCMDLAMKIYRRQLKLHYSVFDITGKEVWGDVAVVDFPSNSNDIREIMEMNFPKIADYIGKTIPQNKAATPENLTEAREYK